MRAARIALFSCLSLLAAGSHAATLLVANKSEATVTVYDLPGAASVATLPTGTGPHEVAVSPDGRRAVVANYGTRDVPGDTLTVVDVSRAAVTGTITLPPGARPHGVEWLDGQRVAVTAGGINSLLLVDVDAMQVARTIAVDQAVAHMVAASAAQGRAFVANIGSGTATAVDLAAARKISDLAAGEGSEGIALVDGGRELWVTNRAAGTVSVFDTASLEKTAELALPGFPIRAEADDGRGLVYITLPEVDALAVLDVRTRREQRRLVFEVPPDRSRKTLFGDRLPESSVPIGVLLSGDGKSLFVAHSSAHVVTVYDAATLSRQAIIATGLEPDGMAWSALSVTR
jgi:DNA-binding beta-propeller fold protein YncE